MCICMSIGVRAGGHQVQQVLQAGGGAAAAVEVVHELRLEHRAPEVLAATVVADDNHRLGHCLHQYLTIIWLARGLRLRGGAAVLPLLFACIHISCV